MDFKQATSNEDFSFYIDSFSGDVTRTYDIYRALYFFIIGTGF